MNNSDKLATQWQYSFHATRWKICPNGLKTMRPQQFLTRGQLRGILLSFVRQMGCLAGRVLTCHGLVKEK